jgi:hypothetical protein
MIIDIQGIEKYIGLQESRIRAHLLTATEAAAEVSQVRRFLEHAGTAETPKQIAYLQLRKFEARLVGKQVAEPLLAPTKEREFRFVDKRGER